VRAPITVGGVDRAMLDHPAVREAIDRATAELTVRFEAAESERRINERVREREHAIALRALQRKAARRRDRLDQKLAQRPAPPAAADYAVIVRGSEALRPLVYGLVDPVEPARVRYVGKTTTGAALRFYGHISEARRKKGLRADWMRGLFDAGRSPDMVLLETVRVGDDLDARERWWINALRQRGEADLNVALPGSATVPESSLMLPGGGR
jgi:hypothetical protein